MAFGGSGGGGFSFGSNNNQGTGFGGFGGSNNNTTGGFGSNTSNTGFGSSTAGTNPFGGGAGGSFGSNTNTGAFGSNTNAGSSLFGGNKSNTTNLFGSSTTNTGSGLFGGGNNSTTTSAAGGFGGASGFGSNSSNAFGGSGSSFGGGFGSSNKPTFGSNSSSTPLFGQGGAGTTGGFGSAGTFGSGGSSTALSNLPVPPAEGTASVPFAPSTEKDGTNNQFNTYQSLTFQQPYQKYSFDELRLADYNAGRRFGNGGGQTGAFGASNFSGFGANTSGSGGFGSSTTNNPFGSNTPSSGIGNSNSTAFGSNTGGGLFGNKPASGGLFGQQSTGTSGGSLFGGTSSNTPSSNPFGGASSSTLGSGSGGGLFGNTQSQNKPSLFGNTSGSTGSTGFSFGNNTSSNTGGGLFGNTGQQPPQSSGGLFGNSNNQQQPKPLFGNSTGGGFGSTSTQGQQPGGLFGSSTNTNTGGGLFGNQQPSNTGGGLFGNTSNNTGGGLFGNQNQNANKPGGLFSGSTFNNNQQQTTGGGLFGNANANNNQSSGGLFGASTNQAPNSFGFGNNNQNKPSGGLFGNTSTNQSGGLFGGTNNSGSLFGGSMSQPQQNQQPQDGIKHASLLDPNPYGQSSIWTGLPAPTMENSKPLVTPLVATQKLKESQAKPPPSLRLNQSRYMTPPKRTGTYGFTYSTYGTPSSAASTPGGNGLTNSMYVSRFSGGSFGRSMGKAASVSNLRSQYADGESVLTPGAFSQTTSRYSSGSIRRLHIDRSIRSDLFSRPAIPALIAPPASANGQDDSDATRPALLESASDTSQKSKKSVTFESGATGSQADGILNGETGALVRTEVDDEGLAHNADHTHEANGSLAPEQSRGNELAIVPEDRESDNPVPKKQVAKVTPLADPEPGDYWMKPTRAEMNKMPRDQLKHFVGFEVGRTGAGKVRFDEAVDLTTVNFDELFSNIIEIRARSVTVYPNPETKPPPGKGLNVPSTISIEHSWPRAKGKPTALSSGHLFEKHLLRLKRIPGTTFKDYDTETGVWTFTVPHYTRYGLDYDDDDMDDYEESQLSAPPDSIENFKTVDMSVMEVDSDNDSSRQDDTFSFKQKTVPGGFGRQPVIDDEMDETLVRSVEQDPDGSEESVVSEEDVSEEDMDMAGSYPEPSGPILNLESPTKPILKPGGFGTPAKPMLDLDGDWASQLQRTISPRKQNRDALREQQNKILLDRVYEPMKPRSAVLKKDFRTSLDVLNAIFDKPERKTRARRGEGHVQAEPDFEFPYAKRAKTFDPDNHAMAPMDREWHNSFKPHFTQTNQLVCESRSINRGDKWWHQENLVRSLETTVEISHLKGQEKLDVPLLLQHATISTEKSTKIPKIEYATTIPFSIIKTSLPPHLTSSLSSTATQLPHLYELVHVLFDTYEDDFSYALTPSDRDKFSSRIRKDRLSLFLSQLLSTADAEKMVVDEKSNPLEAAVRYLARHDVKSACDVLMKHKNFHLAMLVAQIDTADMMFQGDMRKQLDAWREQCIDAEMSDDIRVLYELLAGNTTILRGEGEGPVEDRASTFSISERYGFSWLQGFALHVWYGTGKEEEIEDWVASFEEKVEGGEEMAMPGEDVLWVILRIYASVMAKGKGTGVEKPMLPQALTGLDEKWNAGVAFHVFNYITAGLSGLGKNALRIDREKADGLTATFAAQLEARADVVGAVYALLHLKDVEERGICIQDLLNRHAATLPFVDGPATTTAGDTETHTFALLTTSLAIPVRWIAKAKALHARSSHDAAAELNYLIVAKEYDDAHDCLCRRVAPRLVIDEDYVALKDVLDKFEGVYKEEVQGWNSGAGVYESFVSVVLGEGVKGKGKQLDGVRKGLEAMWRRVERDGMGGSAGEGLEELEGRVAVKEMGRVIARVLEEEGERGSGREVDGGIESQKAILDLPLTADAKMAQAKKMGVEYYRKVMATAK